MSKFPRKIVSNTEPLASTAGMYTTIESLQSFGFFAITAVAITDNTWTTLDDTAVSTSGGYIKLTGTGFASGVVAYINGIACTTTFTSSSELRVVTPALVSGTYSLTAFNTAGNGAIWAAGVIYSGFPIVTTSSYSTSLAVNAQIVASGDAPLTFTLQGGSTLPTGVTLSSTGLLSGTITGITVSTVFTFTVLVNDPQLQTTQQLITLSAVLADTYFNSTVLSLHGDGPAIPATIEVLVVAGGGGARGVSGAIAGTRDSGGGGGGGVIYNAALAITSGAVYPLSIGAGGPDTTNGTNSVWNTTFIASGGGTSGIATTGGATAGGSGGGGANYQAPAGAANQSAYSGWTVYGNAGGAGLDTGPAWGAGGGGGAGAVGSSGTSAIGGAGGIGISNSITGVATYYAGGGGGGAANGAIAAGGTGGGGASTNSAIGGAGTPNTGGGGGGVGNTTGVSYAGGAGGSGVSVIAYPSTYSDLIISSGLTYNMSTVTRSGYKVYTFTAGTGTITIPSNNNNTFKDSSTNNFTVTRTGTPTQGTFTPFSQTGWSGYFKGTTDYLTVPSAALPSGNGSAFTLEMWVNTALPAAVNALWRGASLDFYINSNGTLELDIPGVTGLFVGGSVPLNTWTHIALTRTSGNLYTGYINGVSIGSATNAILVAATTTLFYHNSNAAFCFTGYASNVRATNTLVYTTAFTPPTAPLTAISGTSLLTLQSNYFKDNSSNNFAITATGIPSIQAFSPFAPAAAYSTATVGGSGYFNGTPDYLSVPANAVFAPGTSDFTVEGWFYATANQPNYGGTLYAQTVGGQNYFWISAGNNTTPVTTNVVTFSTNSFQIASSATFQIFTWNHFAVVRASGVCKVYLNGNAGTSTSTTVNLTNTTFNPAIGRYTHDVTNYFPGYISNVRYVNGTALYTANFTPPTAPLTAVTNTSLLLNATNSGIYDATAKNDVTTVGSAQTSATQSKFGGSAMLFNGTTDYLTAIDTPNLQLGTGDFTIEAWVYLTTASTSRGLAAKGPAAATTGWECKFNSANFFRFEWTASFLVGTVAIPITTWTHVAVVRSGSATGNVKLYVNGTLYATSAVAVTDSFTQTDALKIGVDRAGTSFFPGYVDDFRITKYARYTANFTPSATTFLDQ